MTDGMEQEAVSTDGKSAEGAAFAPETNVRFLHGAEGAYVAISAKGFWMDVRLPAGRSAQAGLRRLAEEMQRDVERRQEKIRRMLEAAAFLDARGAAANRDRTQSSRN